MFVLTVCVCVVRQFEESEKKRMKAEQLRQELKHKKQWEDLMERNEAALRELKQLQVGYSVTHHWTCVSRFTEHVM